MWASAEDPVTTARLYYAGTSILLVLYGIFFTLTIICLHYLLRVKRWNWLVLSYTVASLLATTTFLVATVLSGDMILIESHIDSERAKAIIRRLDLMQQIIYLVQVWLADTLLLYRLWVIWGRNYLVAAVPFILWVGSFTSGVVGVSLFHEQDRKRMEIIKYGIGFHTVSIALNVLATLLIAGRLLHQSRIIRDASVDRGREYISLMAVFVESGALYTISGLIFVPLYATNNPLLIIFSVFFGVSAGLAPILILLRIALGVAFECEPRTSGTRGGPVSVLSFATRSRLDDDSEKSDDIHLRTLVRPSNNCSRSSSLSSKFQSSCTSPDSFYTAVGDHEFYDVSDPLVLTRTA